MQLAPKNIVPILQPLLQTVNEAAVGPAKSIKRSPMLYVAL